MKLLSKIEYEMQTAASRDQRMDWWRQARYGMFIHYGLYSQVGRNEWVMVLENTPIEEYEKLADSFAPKAGAAREWAALAKKSGMKYMILTTRHHDGFSLWDSKANPYNSVNYGPKRDIVREYVDACREFGLGVGLYSTLMDWHHPDSWRGAFDAEARARFNQYTLDLNTELMTQYGKIDILWYDVPEPMASYDGWNSLELNQRLRALQPGIIINNRSWLDEDYGTPEEHITPHERDWEACMTFNGISWGYVDSKQAANYSYNAQGILRMLAQCATDGGNLLLNLGPTPDGSIPEEVFGPLTQVGDWLAENGRAAYGHLIKNEVHGSLFRNKVRGNGLCTPTRDEKSVYLWCWLWPEGGSMALGGYKEAPNAVRLLKDGTPIAFEHKGHRIILKDMPAASPDTHAGIGVIEMVFDKTPDYTFASYYPQLHRGHEITDQRI